jgi:hypothetical protein
MTERFRFFIAKAFILVVANGLMVGFIACRHNTKSAQEGGPEELYHDNPFVQEYHEAYRVGVSPGDNEVRSIAVDRASNVWIAAASGVFRKGAVTQEWTPVITGEDRGPAYAVVTDQEGSVLLGTWNGLYTYQGGQLVKAKGVEPPVSVLCSRGHETYAMGPNGVWELKGAKWEPRKFKISRAIRNAATDGKGNLWVATDNGLYHYKQDKIILYQDTRELISCYARAVSMAPGGEIWTGVLGGVSVRNHNRLLKNLTPAEGVPSVRVNCIEQSPEGVMWVGTDVGVVRFAGDYTHTLRFSKRWLTDDRVNDVAFDTAGNAWIATANGVSAIKRRKMTLADKESEYYSQLMKKHIRSPWICGVLRLDIPGDTATWRNSDDDNDGEYTGGYLCMESFRYAVTKDEDARSKARKAFDFLRLLQEVTGTEGFFARTIVPADWKEVHDPNRSYTSRELADMLVEDPRFKPVRERWHLSKDGKWLWKGDTSSDEMDGHMMSYFYYFEYAAGEEEKALIRGHVKKIVDHLIKTGYNLADIDGTHTRWAVWSPEQLNGDPDWASERSINSLELLSYLKLTAHITGEEKYEKEYRRLLDKEGYRRNLSNLNSKNPAWQVYFDRTMEGYLFPILLRYEKDPALKEFYRNLIDEWMSHQEAGENLINNLTYTLATGRKVNVRQTIEFLRDAPLDLVDWRIDHTVREDVQIVRKPILEEIQVLNLPPASERSTVRWDKNPWAAVQGDPGQVREPVFWLWPYWMARYVNIIQ